MYHYTCSYFQNMRGSSSFMIPMKAKFLSYSTQLWCFIPLLDQLVSYGTVSSSSTFLEKLPQTMITLSSLRKPHQQSQKHVKVTQEFILKTNRSISSHTDPFSMQYSWKLEYLYDWTCFLKLNHNVSPLGITTYFSYFLGLRKDQ